MLAPVFHLDGDLLVPTEMARGPWDPGAQHGGPVAAALARAIERCDPVEGLHVMRMTVDLLRPVPLSPLRTDARVVRGGKRVQLLDAALFDGDATVARASAWRLRVARGTTPSIETAPVPAGPETGTLHVPHGDFLGFWTAVEWRFVAGDFTNPGPATGWCRLRTQLFDGEEPTPLQRVLIASDFGNGISGVVDFMQYVYVNVDLVVHLHRPAHGEWVCLESETSVGNGGVGVARSTLFDINGPVGGSAQQLLIDRRPPG